MHNFVVHSNESACRKIGCLGIEQIWSAAGMTDVPLNYFVN